MATKTEEVVEDRAYFEQLATDYMKEHKCRWAIACLEIKRRHPESREAFGAPPKARD